MNENQHSDDEILSGLRLRLSDVEQLIPRPPVWQAVSTGKDEARTRVVVRSRVGVGSFAALGLIAAVVVVAIGVGLGSHAWSGTESAGSPRNDWIGISYQLVHPAGTEVTAAELDATKAVLEKRVASLGATSYSVNEAPPDGVTVTVEGVADAAKLRRVLDQPGRLEFVLLPPETYGTPVSPGSKPVPSSGDSIDPSLPAQFTGADLDPSLVQARVDSSMPEWVVAFGFKEPAASTFETWSGQHVNDFFAIVLDGKVLSAPYIKSQITGGKGLISGAFTAQSAEELATVLQSGWLPYPLLDVSGPGPIVSPDASLPAGIPSSGRTIGDPNAPVTLDVWVDYQCPNCQTFAQGIQLRLIDSYVRQGKVKIVYHDYVVIDSNTGGHESEDAANAARCAADQGKFGTFQDWLWANQGQEGSGAFGRDRLIQIGRLSGLDMDRFQPCVEQGAHLAEVRAESASALAAAVGRTPTVLVAGAQIMSAVDYPTIAAAIDAALVGRPAGPSLPPNATPTFLVYAVRNGDTIASIAAGFGLTPALLEAANPQLPADGSVQVGWKIYIPGPTWVPTAAGQSPAPSGLPTPATP